MTTTTPIALNARAWRELQAQLHLWQWLARYYQQRAAGESTVMAYDLASRNGAPECGRSWSGRQPMSEDHSDVGPEWNREEYIGL